MKDIKYTQSGKEIKVDSNGREYIRVRYGKVWDNSYKCPECGAFTCCEGQIKCTACKYGYSRKEENKEVLSQEEIKKVVENRRAIDKYNRERREIKNAKLIIKLICWHARQGKYELTREQVKKAIEWSVEIMWSAISNGAVKGFVDKKTGKVVKVPKSLANSIDKVVAKYMDKMIDLIIRSKE